MPELSKFLTVDVAQSVTRQVTSLSVERVAVNVSVSVRPYVTCGSYARGASHLLPF